MESPSVTFVKKDSKSAPLQRDRLPQLDAARVISVFAIIWIHTPRSADLIPTIALARFAVPFFVITSVLLILKGSDDHPDRSIRKFAIARIRRLGLPFVTWTLVYLSFKLAKRMVVPLQANDFPGWEVAVVGSAYHLWFLPFILFVSLFVSSVAKRIVACTHPDRLAAISAVVAVVIGFVPPPNLDPRWAGLTFMWLAIPSVVAAIPIYFLLQRPPSQWPEPCRSSFQMAMVLISCTLCLAIVGRNAIAETLAGASFLLLILQLPLSRWTRWLASLAPLTYGIYLSHLLFIKVGESAAARFQIGPSWILDLVIFTVAIWGSISLSWLLSRLTATRWSIGL